MAQISDQINAFAPGGVKTLPVEQFECIMGLSPVIGMSVTFIIEMPGYSVTMYMMVTDHDQESVTLELEP